ncbi:MAG TPA: wax ester/triacylglycerol synthase family O-acyltransferase [Myxococcota bacterium]|nr:wax ester/triacylglycerol synthase family O-acyltransferase [Myxococcota bacterium]
MSHVAYPRTPSRMTTRDAGFLYLERPHSPLHIGCLAVLEEPLPLGALARHIETRMPRMRRYAQRAVGVPLDAGHPTWEDDPGFDVRRHLHAWALPSPGGEAELAEAVGHLLTLPLDRGRPLWDMHLLEGFHGGCVVLQRVHHCMVDGMAGAQLLEVLLDATPDTPNVVGRVEPPPVPLSGGSERLASALGSFVSGGLRSGVGALTALARPAAARANLERLRSAAFAALHLATDEVPELPWNGPIGPERRLAFTRIPMQGVRHIRSRLGGTVNDVVLSIVAGGLHRQLVSVGMSLRGVELTTMVPVSLRSADEAASLGNRISAMLIPLAVDLESEIARYAATCAITDRLKARADWVGIDALLALLDGLPPALVAGVGKRLRIGRLANLITTNVPGPRETRWLCGRRVEGLRPLVPIVDGIGLGIAIFSYDGWLEIGINADAARVPDLEKLQRGIESAFASLLASA